MIISYVAPVVPFLNQPLIANAMQGKLPFQEAFILDLCCYHLLQSMAGDKYQYVYLACALINCYLQCACMLLALCQTYLKDLEDHILGGVQQFIEQQFTALSENLRA
jgi:hypothetical protein